MEVANLGLKRDFQAWLSMIRKLVALCGDLARLSAGFYTIGA